VKALAVDDDEPVTGQTPPSWTQDARDRYAQLEGRLLHVTSSGARDVIAAKLARAHGLIKDPIPKGWHRRLANWWSGDRIERAWVWLEEAEIEIVQHSDDAGLRVALSVAMLRAEHGLAADNTHRQVLTKFADLAAENRDESLATLAETFGRPVRRTT
jgi:hypothetical protein